MSHKFFDWVHLIRSIDSDAQDPTSMTIEFLRARLLAERAVSKSARAKLDGLADKVAELEEQLKIVSLQRKKAEQATADVLAILEENGFTDVSDAYDSSSDHESYSHTNSGKSFILQWRKVSEIRSRAILSIGDLFLSQCLAKVYPGKDAGENQVLPIR